MWMHRSADQTLTIVREAPKYPILRSPAGVIIIQRIPGRAADMSKDYDRIASDNERARNGYQFREVHRLTTAKGYGYCWEFVRLNSSYLSISCRFDNDTLAAAYEGSPAYRDEFYNAIETASGESSPSNQR
jgi:hypothetical protein